MSNKENYVLFNKMNRIQMSTSLSLLVIAVGCGDNSTNSKTVGETNTDTSDANTTFDEIVALVADTSSAADEQTEQIAMLDVLVGEKEPMNELKADEQVKEVKNLLQKFIRLIIKQLQGLMVQNIRLRIY